MVTETSGARRGALLGAIWGVGHTASLIVVGAILLLAGEALPARVAAAFELAVAVMLIGLGVRALVRAARDGAAGPSHHHRHGGAAHVHAGALAHVHVGHATLAWRPLVVGLIHGLAGSGALTALVFAELPGTTARLVYITLFGAGSIAGMAIASGIAGASLGRIGRVRHQLAYAAGALSIVVGIAWGIPLVGTFA
jgi:high-affinity nickel-transport protein